MFEILLWQIQNGKQEDSTSLPSGNLELGLPDAISYAGFMLERETMIGWAEETYRGLLPEPLFHRRLTKPETEQLVDGLICLLQSRHATLAGGAAWALGKTRFERVAPELLRVVRAWPQLDDNLIYQSLIALDNFGLAAGSEVVAQIANQGPNRSKEFACRLLARKKRNT